MTDYIIVPFLTPVLVCIFWFLELIFTSGDNSTAKKHLAIFFLCGVISFFASFLFAYELFYLYIAKYPLTAFFYFAQIPSLYIYLLFITGERLSNLRYVKHYLIPILSTVIVIYINYIHISPRESIELFFNFFSPEELSQKQKISFIANVALRVLFLCYVVFYMALIQIKALKHFKRVQNYYSNGYGKDLSWIRVANIFYALNIILGVIVFNPRINNYVDDITLIGIIPHFLLGIVFWYIGFKGNRQEAISTPTKLESLGFVPEDVRDSIKTKLTQFIDKEKVFLQQELTLPELAKEIGTNRFYLSKVINDDLGVSFSSYINKHRVVYAIDLLENNEMSLGDIATRSGFNSYISFLRSFKKFTNQSPDKYKLDKKIGKN